MPEWTKLCTFCGKPWTAVTRREQREFFRRMTCSTECAYRLRARSLKEAQASGREPATEREMPLHEAARVVAAPFARQRWHWDTATEAERRLFAPELRSRLEAGA